MKTIKIVLYITLLAAVSSAVAQQDPNRILYRYNMNLINPAYAGSNGGGGDSFNTIGGRGHDAGSELGINIRSQWAGVEGAPETQSIFFGTGLSGNVGLGVSIVNDRTFIESQTSIAVDFSYKLKFGESTDLYLGVKGGAVSYNVNTSGLVTFGIGPDPFLSDIEGGFSPSFGAGLYLRGANYFLSMSIPNIISSERLEQNNGLASLGNSRNHYYLSFGYDLGLSKALCFKPSVMVRHIDAAPLSVDLTGTLVFNDRFGFGANYRLDEGIAGLVMINVSDWFDLGYAYGAALESPISGSSNGSHEIFMKLNF